MRRRLGRFGLSLLLALLLGPGSAAAQPASESAELDRMRAERRVALVIGNGAYRYAPELTNPSNDAAGLAAALRRLGFTVEEKVDLDRNGTLAALHQFSRLLENADVGLFFYAGHALQVGGRNYLVPVDAQLEREADLIFQAVELDDALRLLEQQARTSLVFLDACRDNPLARTLARSMGTRSQAVGRGLAEVASGAGTLIAFATSPGNVAADGQGANSPFTAALLEQIETPGLEIGRLLARVTGAVRDETKGRQVPWLHSSLTGDFYFLPPPAAAPAAAPPAGAPPRDVELWNIWSAIKDSQDPADFETFIALYPDSPLAPFARNRKLVLETARAAPEPARELPVAAAEPSAPTSGSEPAPAPAPAAPAVAALPPRTGPAAAEPAAAPDPAAVEAALGLSREQRAELQVALTALGHDTRGADGILGRNSRAALTSWQQSAGEEATGYLTAMQHGKLLAEAEPKLAALAAARQKPEQAAPVQPAVGIYRHQTGDEFRDCPDCPLMVVVPAGSFLMGSPSSEQGRAGREGPQHAVTIRQTFAVGKYEVTFGEWDACVAAGGCNRYRPDDNGWRRDRRPVINVSWYDAKAYVAWLSAKTGEPYRLLSEAEWEYTARAGTTTPFSTGVTISTEQANYASSLVFPRTLPVDTFGSNPWGLHDVHGNVYEWVEDCRIEPYISTSQDGSARTTGDCSRRMLRGGSWVEGPDELRSANRGRNVPDYRGSDVGFRVARTLSRSESVTP